MSKFRVKIYIDFVLTFPVDIMCIDILFFNLLSVLFIIIIYLFFYGSFNGDISVWHRRLVDI